MAWVLMGSACGIPAAKGAALLPTQPHLGVTPTSGDHRLSSLSPLQSSLRRPLSRRMRSNSRSDESSRRGAARASGETEGTVKEWEPFVEALRHHHRQPLEEPGETPGHTRAGNATPDDAHSRLHSHKSGEQPHSHSHAPTHAHGHEHSHEHPESRGHSHNHTHEHSDGQHQHQHHHHHSHGHDHAHEHQASGHSHAHVHAHKQEQQTNGHAHHIHNEPSNDSHHHHEGHSHSHSHPHSHSDPHSHSHSHSHSHPHSHSHSHPHQHEHEGTEATHSPGHQHSHGATQRTPAHTHQHQHAHSHPPAPLEPQEAAPGTPTQPVLVPGSLPVAVAPRRAPLVTLDPSWRPRGQALEANAGAGKVLFVDAQTAGVAGDMMVAALLDLGVPPDVLGSGLEGLGMDGFTCHITSAERSAISATRFLVQEVGPQPFRDYGIIRRVLQHQSSLPPGAAAIALSAFKLLAEAEASVHGVPVDSVHFHEVGAIDSIVDIVASAIAFDYLGWRPSSAEGVPGPEGRPLQVAVSRLPMGRGIIRGAAHGPLPCPAPATLDVLCRSGVPTFDAGTNGELVTPTGACLVGALANKVTSWPAMVPERAAYGAGTKSWADRPNLLRLVLGTPLAS